MIIYNLFTYTASDLNHAGHGQTGAAANMLSMNKY